MWRTTDTNHAFPPSLKDPPKFFANLFLPLPHHPPIFPSFSCRCALSSHPRSDHPNPCEHSLGTRFLIWTQPHMYSRKRMPPQSAVSCVFPIFTFYIPPGNALGNILILGCLDQPPTRLSKSRVFFFGPCTSALCPPNFAKLLVRILVGRCDQGVGVSPWSPEKACVRVIHCSRLQTR